MVQQSAARAQVLVERRKEQIIWANFAQFRPAVSRPAILADALPRGLLGLSGSADTPATAAMIWFCHLCG
jgi:hypothetical protein